MDLSPEKCWQGSPHDSNTGSSGFGNCDFTWSDILDLLWPASLSVFSRFVPLFWMSMDHPKPADQREYDKFAWTSPKKEASWRLNGERFGQFMVVDGTKWGNPELCFWFRQLISSRCWYVLWELTIYKVKFSIVGHPETQSGIEAMGNGFAQPHFGPGSTRMKKGWMKIARAQRMGFQHEGKIVEMSSSSTWKPVGESMQIQIVDHLDVFPGGHISCQTREWVLPDFATIDCPFWKKFNYFDRIEVTHLIWWIWCAVPKNRIFFQIAGEDIWSLLIEVFLIPTEHSPFCFQFLVIKYWENSQNMNAKHQNDSPRPFKSDIIIR
jgi:hypothetical protein